MNDEHDIKALWQNQTTETTTMPLEEIRKEAGKFHSRIRRRNVREYAASVFVVGIFGFYIWVFPAPLLRIGSVLIIAGTLYMVWQLRKRGTSNPLPAADSAAAWIDYHRHELTTQRDALRSIWKWYLGPFVPGIVVFMAGMSMQLPRGTQAWIAQVSLAGTIALCLVVFGGVWALNAWGARRLQRKIDELGR